MQWIREEDSRNWVFYFLIACGAGILLRSVFRLPLAVTVFVALLGVAFTVLFALRATRNTFLIALCLMGCALGATRMQLSDMVQPDAVLAHALGSRVVLEGVVTKEPDVRDRNQLLTVTVQRLGGVHVSDGVLVSADAYLAVAYGDRVRLTGELSLPENFETDSGNLFPYEMFLAKDGIHFRMLYPEVKVVGVDEGNVIIAALLSIKKSFLDRLQAILVEPHVSLLGGLLVGAKQSLGEDLLEAFRKTGVVHIVVLSGYNMTLVAEAVMRLLVLLPRHVALTSGAGTIVLFALMTGASATIVRASLMALLVLLARATGRIYDVTRALFLAAFIMLMHNPYLLAFDPSFQLSFLATLGLIHLAPQLERWAGFVFRAGSLRSLVAATIATQILVLPLLLYQTGAISVIAVLANLLVLPLVPATMLFGFLSGLLSFVHSFAALPFSVITYLLLSFELWIVELLATVPYASLPVKGFPLWGVFVAYAAALIVWAAVRWKGRVAPLLQRNGTENNKTA